MGQERRQQVGGKASHAGNALSRSRSAWESGVSTATWWLAVDTHLVVPRRLSRATPVGVEGQARSQMGPGVV